MTHYDDSKETFRCEHGKVRGMRGMKTCAVCDPAPEPAQAQEEPLVPYEAWERPSSPRPAEPLMGWSENIVVVPRPAEPETEPEHTLGPKCINCGERDGGYEIGTEERGAIAGPFCASCYDEIDEHYRPKAQPPQADTGTLGRYAPAPWAFGDKGVVLLPCYDGEWVRYDDALAALREAKGKRIHGIDDEGRAMPILDNAYHCALCGYLGHNEENCPDYADVKASQDTTPITALVSMWRKHAEELGKLEGNTAKNRDMMRLILCADELEHALRTPETGGR